MMAEKLVAARFHLPIKQHTLMNSAEKKHRINFTNNQQFYEKTHAKPANFNMQVSATTKGRVGNKSDQSKHTSPRPS
jgi:hypothetical protein